jgi:hypothetical protein
MRDSFAATNIPSEKISSVAWSFDCLNLDFKVGFVPLGARSLNARIRVERFFPPGGSHGSTSAKMADTTPILQSVVTFNDMTVRRSVLAFSQASHPKHSSRRRVVSLKNKTQLGWLARIVEYKPEPI